MSDEPVIEIRETQERDASWIKDMMVSHWGGLEVVVHGDVFIPHLLPGYVAVTTGGERVGLVTFVKQTEQWEIITLNSQNPGLGIGTSLISEVITNAKKNSCSSVILTTTNDNLKALDFYLKKGFGIREIHAGAVDQSRKIKPAIPTFSSNGLPIRDEIDLVLDLN